MDFFRILVLTIVLWPIPVMAQHDFVPTVTDGASSETLAIVHEFVKKVVGERVWIIDLVQEYPNGIAVTVTIEGEHRYIFFIHEGAVVGAQKITVEGLTEECKE